ncbi:hypothetical protein KEJ49_04890 [Candidatus Bathyarchaeota archaeon]|nr:hypothetical protein [Candidatus Bathyarchaeota archaeon]
MFPPFGIYTTIAGLTAVLVTLSAVVVSIEILKRALAREVKTTMEGRGETLKLAAALSAINCLLDGEAPTPKMIISENSSWPISARLDSLRNFWEDQG